jgi:hypothetical protein
MSEHPTTAETKKGDVGLCRSLTFISSSQRMCQTPKVQREMHNRRKYEAFWIDLADKSLPNASRFEIRGPDLRRISSDV